MLTGPDRKGAGDPPHQHCPLSTWWEPQQASSTSPFPTRALGAVWTDQQDLREDGQTWGAAHSPRALWATCHRDAGVPVCLGILEGHNPSGLPPPPALGHPLCRQLKKQMGNGNKESPPLCWSSAPWSSQQHLHLHVPMHIGGQGGPVKHKVVHHHVQCQSWSPVRNGLIQGTCGLLCFDLLLNERKDFARKA